MNVAFMDGLSAGCLLVGVLCLLGAAASWLALPGERYDPVAEGRLAEVVTD